MTLIEFCMQHNYLLVGLNYMCTVSIVSAVSYFLSVQLASNSQLSSD